MRKFLILSELYQKNLENNFELIFIGKRLRSTIKKYKKKKKFKIFEDVYCKDKIENFTIELENIFQIVLKTLSITLNNYHNINYSESFWRIILSPWLLNFLEATFDKWLVTEKILSSIKIDDTFGIDKDSFILNEIIPLKSSDIINLRESSLWNLYINEKIVKEIDNNINFHSIKVDKISLRNNVYEKDFFLKKLNFFLNKDDKYFISFFDLEKIKFIKLNLYLRQFPFVSKRQQIINNKDYDFEFRNKELNFNNLQQNLFFKFLEKEILKHIPKLFLEDFKKNIEVSLNSSWPKKPEIIMSSIGLWYQDFFNFYLALRKEKFNSKLYYFQHGAEYGSSKIFIRENIEKKCSDKYFTWGWKKDNKDIPIGILKNIKISKNNIDFKKKFIIITRLQNFKFQMHHGNFHDSSWINYHKNNALIIRGLQKKKLSKEIIVRYKKNNFKKKDIDIYEKFKNIKIDLGDKPLEKYSKSHFYIFTYNSTVFLEFLARDIPCVCLMDSTYKLNDFALKKYNYLKKAKIIFEEPNDLLTSLSININNIYKWWYNDENIMYRSLFCGSFAYKDHNLLNNLIRNIKE